MTCVIDCSFSSSLFLPDENSSISTNFFKKYINKKSLLVPVLWWYETCNVIYIAVKRKRITPLQAQEILNLLNALKLETDTEYGLLFSTNIFNLSNLYSISTYDAVYLDLSLRKKATLATFDAELKAAALKAGVPIIPAQ